MVLDLFQIKIKTPRLTLVPISKSDAQSILKEFTEEITTYMYPKPPESIEDVLDFIHYSIETMKVGNNVQLVITNKRNGEFLGCIGLHHIDQKNPELGIWLKKSAHGNGYGLEAIRHLVEWAKKNVGFDHLKYPVDTRNVPSKRIPEVLGGAVQKAYKKKALSGHTLDILEYWIKPK